MTLGKLNLAVVLIAWSFGCTAWALAEEGAVAWEFPAGDEIFGSPAIDGEGNLYFGSRDNKVYSLDPSGELRWEFATGDWVDSSPTLSHDEKVVYVGSWDNSLYALSTAEDSELSATDGRKIWSFETGSLIVASPALDAAGNLYFGSSDGFFYSLTPAGAVRWSYLVGAEMDSSPAVAADGSVYVGAYDGRLYAFTPEGELKWSFETETTEDPANQRIKAQPTVDAAGNVYFGAGDGNVYALDNDGSEIWRFAARESVDTGVVIGANDTLIFGSRDGYVYCVDGLGVVEWESYVGDVFYSTPAVDEFGRIYVGAYVGNGVSGVTVLSQDGELLWDSLTLSYIDSSPLLSGKGHMYFGSYDGVFYAVEAYAALADSAWSRFGGDGANRSQQRPLARALRTSSAYTEWLQSYGLYGDEATAHFDGDGDQAGLLLEYLMGGDPQVPDGALAQVGASASKNGVVELRFNRRKNESAYQLRLECSQDLVQWDALEAPQFEMAEQVLDEDTFGDGVFETVQVRLKAGERLFARAVGQAN